MELMKAPRRGRRNQVAVATAPPELGRLSQSPLPPAQVLRRYAIGERISVKIGVITQTRPRAVLLCCVCDAGFLTFGKIVPRIISSNGEEGPIGNLRGAASIRFRQWCRLVRSLLRQGFCPIAPDGRGRAI
jgi:hypothetical protein